MNYFLSMVMNFVMCWCLCGCAKMADYPQSAEYYEQSYDDYGAYAQMEMPYEQEANFMQSKIIAPSNSYKGKQSFSNSKNIPEPQQNVSDMIHYNGYASLQVDRIDDTLTEIIEISKTINGTIERQSSKSITIRVPKTSFHAVFLQILELGEVLQKSITSEDVSEVFTSVELRLKTSKTTRDRLIALLEKTKDDEEKIKLLREIQRLNEQIDRMEAQIRTLQNLADFSNISVDVTSKRAEQSSTNREFESAGFSWIHNLSPFQSTVCQSGKRLEIEIEDGLVVLNKKGAFVAESADGVVLRSTRLDNNPKGDSTFWKQAIQGRLEKGFGNVKNIDPIGGFLGVELWEDSNAPYIWHIYIRVAGDDLDLIEVFFPDENRKSRYIESIQAGIGGVQ